MLHSVGVCYNKSLGGGIFLLSNSLTSVGKYGATYDMSIVKVLSLRALTYAQAPKVGGECFENLADFGCAEARSDEAQL